jgi:hypothetical protein
VLVAQRQSSTLSWDAKAPAAVPYLQTTRHVDQVVANYFQSLKKFISRPLL